MTKFRETHCIPVALVTPACKEALFCLTGKVNAAPFKGFAPGEVLFRGASSSRRGAEDWEITFSFVVNPNVAGGLNGVKQIYSRGDFSLLGIGT